MTRPVATGALAAAFCASLITACSPPATTGTSTPELESTTRASTPAGEAFKAANDEMHAAMSAALSGDTDIDFVRSMIPHQEAAVTMARIELKFGKDPALLAMAAEIVRTHQIEIEQMNAWLDKRAKGKR